MLLRLVDGKIEEIGQIEPTTSVMDSIKKFNEPKKNVQCFKNINDYPLSANSKN